MANRGEVEMEEYAEYSYFIAIERRPHYNQRHAEAATEHLADYLSEKGLEATVAHDVC